MKKRVLDFIHERKFPIIVLFIAILLFSSIELCEIGCLENSFYYHGINILFFIFAIFSLLFLIIKILIQKIIVKDKKRNVKDIIIFIGILVLSFLIILRFNKNYFGRFALLPVMLQNIFESWSMGFRGNFTYYSVVPSLLNYSLVSSVLVSSTIGSSL